MKEAMKAGEHVLREAAPAAARPAFAARLLRFAKEALFFAYLYCGYVQLRDALLALLGRSRAVVLYYHRVGPRDVLTRAPEDFRRDLAYLKQRYECISLAELCRRLEAGEPFRRRAAVVTFDDGYRDNFTEAAPLLIEAGVPATFYVATGFIGADRDFPHDLRDRAPRDGGAYFAKLTWDDLRAMQEAGFEIGSHTVHHANLGRADEATLAAELGESLAALNRELGERRRAFSFPWGKPEDISARAVEAVRRAGYYAAASAYGGTNTRGADPFNILRVDVGNGHLSRLAWRARVAGLDPDYVRHRRKFRL